MNMCIFVDEAKVLLGRVPAFAEREYAAKDNLLPPGVEVLDGMGSVDVGTDKASTFENVIEATQNQLGNAEGGQKIAGDWPEQARERCFHCAVLLEALIASESADAETQEARLWRKTLLDLAALLDSPTVVLQHYCSLVGEHVPSETLAYWKSTFPCLSSNLGLVRPGDVARELY